MYILAFSSVGSIVIELVTVCKALTLENVYPARKHCNILQHTATHYNALQQHCNNPSTFGYLYPAEIETRRCCLQHTTEHCNTQQQTATHCNNTATTLQQHCNNTAVPC